MTRPHLFAAARFCPWCGGAIRRDDYRRDHPTPRRGYHNALPEYLCDGCGAAFRLAPSLRHEHANSEFKAHRRMREPRERREDEG